MKKFIFYLLLFAPSVLAGCWDQRELSQITVVTGMAIDKGENGKYLLNVEGINAQELNNRTASGFAPSIVYGLEGNSVEELSQKMNVAMSRDLIYSHMKTLIIGEKVAEDGMLEFIDYLERDREIRDDFNILVARGVKASDILKVTYQFQKSSPLKLHTQIQSMLKMWGGDPNVRLNDLIEALTSTGRQPVIAAVSIDGDPEKGQSAENMKKVTPDAIVTLDSLAIFDALKLKGYISLNDTRNYLWIEDKLKRTSLTVPCKKGHYFDAEIYNTKTRVDGKINNGSAEISLNVMAEAFLDGTQCPADFNKIKVYKEYEHKVARQIEKNLSYTIKKVQRDYKLDIFGFGEFVRRQDYKNYKAIENQWDEYFSNSQVDVKVVVRLRRTGIRTKSFLTDLKK